MKKLTIKSLPLFFILLFFASQAFAASPWTEKETYGSKVAGKFIYGIKNAGFFWLQPLKEAKSECYNSEWEGFTYGIGQSVHYMVSGLVQLATFPIPVDFPDAGTGLTEVPRDCGKKKPGQDTEKKGSVLDDFVRVPDETPDDEVVPPAPPEAKEEMIPETPSKDAALTQALEAAKQSEPVQPKMKEESKPSSPVIPSPKEIIMEADSKPVPRSEPIDWETDFEPKKKKAMVTTPPVARRKNIVAPKPPVMPKAVAPAPTQLPKTFPVRKEPSLTVEDLMPSEEAPLEVAPTKEEIPEEPTEAIFKTDELTEEEQAELDAAFLKLFEEAEEFST